MLATRLAARGSAQRTVCDLADRVAALVALTCAELRLGKIGTVASSSVIVRHWCHCQLSCVFSWY